MSGSFSGFRAEFLRTFADKSGQKRIPRGVFWTGVDQSTTISDKILVFSDKIGPIRTALDKSTTISDKILAFPDKIGPVRTALV